MYFLREKPASCLSIPALPVNDPDASCGGWTGFNQEKALKYTFFRFRMGCLDYLFLGEGVILNTRGRLILESSLMLPKQDSCASASCGEIARNSAVLKRAPPDRALCCFNNLER